MRLLEIQARRIGLGARAVFFLAAALAGGTGAQAANVPLYYQDPDGKPFYSPTQKSTPDGRAFRPVYKDNTREPGALSSPAAAQSADQSSDGKGRVLYYRNPMSPQDTSPVPKKDPMGMSYVPVYENEVDANVVQVSPGKLQMLGVRTASVESALSLTHTIRGAGSLQLDERRIATITTRAGGWAEKIRIAIGEPVRRGDALLDFYSPELTAAEGEYIAAADSGERNLATAAIDRLRTLGVSQKEIDRLKSSRTAARLIPVVSPIDGIVADLQVTQGARVEPQMPLYRIADLSSLWLIAEIQEQDVGMIVPGQKAHATFVAAPGRRFDGEVDFIYAELTRETHTARVRIALANPDLALRAGLYASIEIESPAPVSPQSLAVPDSAVIDSGTEQVLLVEKAEGIFEPRRVHLGARGDGYIEVLAGVSRGEKVVVGANFLIDSESNLRAALQSFAPATGGAPQ